MWIKIYNFLYKKTKKDYFFNVSAIYFKEIVKMDVSRCEHVCVCVCVWGGGGGGGGGMCVYVKRIVWLDVVDEV